MLKRLWPTTKAQINVAITVDESTRSDPDRALHVHEQRIDVILGGDPVVIEAVPGRPVIHRRLPGRSRATSA
jgi:hypothetical protein